MTNVFLGTTINITMFDQEFIKRLRRLITQCDISAKYNEGATRYYIDDGFGLTVCIKCALVMDTDNRPAHHYAIMLDDNIIMESYCLHDAAKHSEQARQLIELANKCRDKVLYQEIRARRDKAQHENTTTKKR